MLMHKKEGTVLRMLIIANFESCRLWVYEICYFSDRGKLHCRSATKVLVLGEKKLL
jgi:hypothetical protein